VALELDVRVPPARRRLSEFFHAGTFGQLLRRSYALLMKEKTGKFLGIPYDWRRPTLARLKSRWWNPSDPRLFPPRMFGWGFAINFARLLRRH
jgi:hypothetical protein